MNKVKKIDIHAHVKPSFATSGEACPTPLTLMSIYDELNIEKGVILPFMPSGEGKGSLTNENAKITADEYPENFSWFTTVDLESFDFENKSLFDFLKNQKEKGAKGIGEVTSNISISDPRVEKLFECANALSMPLLFHLNYEYGKNYGIVDTIGLSGLDTLLSRYPDLKFIGHSEVFWIEISRSSAVPVEKGTKGNLSSLLRKHNNLYCDLSAGSGADAMMKDPLYAAAFMEEFSDRIFYGCDITSPSNTHQYKLCAFFDELYDEGKISEKVYRKIARENAVNILKI